MIYVLIVELHLLLAQYWRYYINLAVHRTALQKSTLAGSHARDFSSTGLVFLYPLGPPNAYRPQKCA
jgi:hypothetical protein